MRRNPQAQCPEQSRQWVPISDEPLHTPEQITQWGGFFWYHSYISVIAMTQSHTHLTSHEWTLNSLYSRPLVRWYTKTEPLLVPIKTTGEMSANLARESIPPKSFVKFTFYKRIQTIYLKKQVNRKENLFPFVSKWGLIAYTLKPYLTSGTYFLCKIFKYKSIFIII